MGASWVKVVPVEDCTCKNSPAHDFMCEENSAHFWVFVLSLVGYGLRGGDEEEQIEFHTFKLLPSGGG